MTALRFSPAGAAALALCVAGGRLAAQDLPADIFNRPSGPHAVGTYDWLWIDESRPERYTKDPNDKRHLPVQVWYPADSAAGGTPAPYIRTQAEFGSTGFKNWVHITTHSVTGAPLAGAERKYPVLVYSHGAGWTRFSATFITELLASYGYVVFSIDHPGLDRTVAFSDGTAFKADTLTMPAPDPKQDIRATMAGTMTFLNDIAFPMWIEDSRYVLDRIEALNREPGPFKGRLDLGRIGMLGWSFGGAAAIEMLRIDRRVKAAVNHDGRLFGGVLTEPVGRGPFMLFHHGIDDAATAPEASRQAIRDMGMEVQRYDSAARARAGGDWYDVTIARANHGHFSDLPLLLKTFQDTTLVPPRRGHEIITAYTLAFFDRYLKGIESPLLAAPSPQFPEVAFRRR